MLLKIISYIKGYIKVSVKGGFPERFLNLCAAADRDIWQVKTEKEGISFFSDIREYKNLRSSAKRTGVKMRVTENTDFRSFSEDIGTDGDFWRGRQFSALSFIFSRVRFGR